jgi:predicted phage terminase large subunit-like protein
MPQTQRSEAPWALERVDLSSLTAEERLQLDELAEARFGGERLAPFIRRLAPEEPPPRHIYKVIEVIERARAGPMRVCISMPPRHAKTITVLRAIAWWLLRSPADTCGYFSYNHDIAHSKSRIARTIALQSGVRLSDSTGVAEWRTAEGGGLLAGGAGGGLPGQGITGFVVVDDPFKNREDADSELNRQRVWEWFNEVVMTRLERGSVIVIHTRWHEDDLIGRLEHLGGWEIIRLQAIAEENDPLGREPGEALWDRFPASELGTEPGQRGTIRGQIGEFSFAALYQQQPRPRGAKLFGPASYFDPQRFDMTGWRCVIAADPAGSEKTSADWSAAVVLAIRGKRPEIEGRVMDVYRKQVSIPDFARALRALQMQWHLAPIYVEAVAGFKAVPQLLRENDPSLAVFEAPTLGDKWQRAQLVSAAWNAAPSRVLVPMNSPPWLGEFLHELQKFTGVRDTHDDQVDALAHAWNAAALGPEPPVFTLPGGPVLPRRR